MGLIGGFGALQRVPSYRLELRWPSRRGRSSELLGEEEGQEDLFGLLRFTGSMVVGIAPLGVAMVLSVAAKETGHRMASKSVGEAVVYSEQRVPQGAQETLSLCTVADWGV